MLNRTHREWQLAGFFFGLTAILALLIKTNADLVQSFDNVSFELVAQFDSSSMTQFFKLIAILASPAVTLTIALLFGVLLYVTHQRACGLLVMITMFGGDAAALVVKLLVKRLRPTQQLLADTGYSFPSGHVFGTVLLMILLFAIGLPLIHSHPLHVALICLGVIWIAIVIVSRIYLRDHFASDTVGSLTLASGCWQQARAWFFAWQPRTSGLLNRDNH